MHSNRQGQWEERNQRIEGCERDRAQTLHRLLESSSAGISEEARVQWLSEHVVRGDNLSTAHLLSLHKTMAHTKNKSELKDRMTKKAWERELEAEQEMENLLKKLELGSEGRGATQSEIERARIFAEISKESRVESKSSSSSSSRSRSSSSKSSSKSSNRSSSSSRSSRSSKSSRESEFPGRRVTLK